jgi:hypothetical protein
VQTILYRLKIKPGMMSRFKEYVAEFESRRAECDASMVGEGADAESFFYVDDEVFVSKRVQDIAAMKHYQKTSGDAIYDVVKRMDADCILEQTVYPAVLSFDILKD